MFHRESTESTAGWWCSEKVLRLQSHSSATAVGKFSRCGGNAVPHG
ncbi:MAG: hypothetical protein IJ901_02155 [Bacteroidaceae bacterium]|nr:hypothetical protein [Bacteroidaceae bacterium]